MAFQELLKVRSVKHVEQKAFDGGVSHRGFPGCADCTAVDGRPLLSRRPWTVGEASMCSGFRNLTEYQSGSQWCGRSVLVLDGEIHGERISGVANQSYD